MSDPVSGDRDRDATGRARNARPRDELGRPLDRSAAGESPQDGPALPPDEALRQAQELLDSGRPFAAHEVLEAVWKDTHGPTHELWRGLAQVAVGMTHSLRENNNGARALLLRAAGSLAPYAGTSPHRIDVDGIRAWALAAGARPDLAALTPRLVIPPDESSAVP